MATAPNCTNPHDKHRTSYVPMTRLYVREKVGATQYGTPSKRKWVGVGWVCNSVASYQGEACGHVILDQPAEAPAVT
jgi:hypothetical protein